MKTTNATKLFKKIGAEAVYTTCDYLCQYLSGFFAEDAFILSDKKGNIFYTDARYMESAEKFFAETDITVAQRPTEEDVNEMLSCYHTVAVPFSKMSYYDCKKLENIGISLLNSDSFFQSAMSIKSEEEISFIQKACDIAQEGLLATFSQIKEGMTEKEVAAILEYQMRIKGAEGTSFDTIVAFGSNASVPHHQTDDTKLVFGQEILIDFGCKVNGYCSDCTRTFLYGDDNKHEKFKKLYQIVLEAQQTALKKIHTGITGKEADAFARDIFRRHNLEKYFTHSLGHGIGLNIHEYPKVSPFSQDILYDGMVFSDEPGLYLAGEIGIRIEDSTYLQGGILHSFMQKTEKNLIIL